MMESKEEIRRRTLEIEAEGVRLMNEAEAEHLAKIFSAPIETDEDYEYLAELTDPE